MKTRILSVIFITITFIIKAQTTYVPDNNFEQALISLGFDDELDDYVSTENINTITSLNVSGKEIADLTGIEEFIALTSLNVANNSITELDISANVKLTKIECQSNLISALDFRKNTKLTFIDCYNNKLTQLNVKNGNNINVNTFRVSANPNLQCIQVDDAAFSTESFQNGGVWLRIPAGASFNENCNYELTYIPDDNFEQALIDLGYDDKLDDYVPTENINNVYSLYLLNKGIADLTGIEAFEDIRTLSCHNNNLTTLDLSNNTKLEILYCADNQFTVLDVTKNINLKTLHAYENQLTVLDVTKNINLEELYVNHNQLTSLGVSTNTALTELVCSYNQLTSIDVSTNTALTELGCDNNQLTSLDVSRNTKLEKLTCSGNQLTSLDVSSNTKLKNLACSRNQLTSLDVSANTALTVLYCFVNNLTELDIKNGNNVNIIDFNAINNSNLTCVQVDNETNFAKNWASKIDATATFSENCNSLGVFNEYELSYTIYPNPTKANLTVNVLEKSNLVIYSVSGKEIAKRQLKSGENKILDLKIVKGVYFFKVTSNNKTAIKKVVYY